MDESGIFVRVERVEEDLRELRMDIRNLTNAVANLASTVAVLSERLAQRQDVTTAPPPASVTTPSLALAGAAIGAAVITGAAKWLGLN
jgi:hypothetical protein